MQRVMLVGPPGSGKSTLARHLGERLDLPFHHLDRMHWRAGWVEGSQADLRARLETLCAEDRWLIDGHYGGSIDIRARRADTIIYLDFPIRLCLLRVAKRVFAYRGRTRPDMADGCPEKFDFAFLLFLLRWRSGPRRRTEARLAPFAEKVVRLRSPKELARWLESVESHPA